MTRAAAGLANALRPGLWLGLGLWLVSWPPPAVAQPPVEDVEDPFATAFEAADIEIAHRGGEDDPRIAEAWRAVEEWRLIDARELAESILTDDPESIAGLAVLGIAQHRGEGNLPIALFHLKRSRKLLEARYGPMPGEDAPWRWHVQILRELAMVTGEMGRHEEKVRLLLERDALYHPPTPADRGWPLMRLRRYGDARAAAEMALTLDDPDQQASARTALCAIEAEQQRREAGYLACIAAANWEREHPRGGPTPYTNAAEAALGMLRMDEAERLINEGTEHFGFGSVSNPWLDLLLLYLAEGRTSEAVDALHKMRQWRRRQPPFMDEQNRTETEMATAIFLIVAGYPDEASRITSRAVDRPDRTGFTSSESEQLEAAAALADLLANRTGAELLAEIASWSSFRDSVGARLASLDRRLRAWSSGRRAASLVAEDRMLTATIRPYLAGSVEIPEWIAPEVIAALGPGIAAAAVRRAREREDLAGAEGYFLAWEAEIASLKGRERDALRLAREALAALPQSEVLLGARVAALGADAALRAGQRSQAAELFDTALQADPGIIRRLGLELPVSFAPAQGPVADKARRYLRRSPRLRDEPGGGFRVEVQGDASSGIACLLGAQGAGYGCGQVTARAGEDSPDLARRLAAEFHAVVFAPRLDLTQAEIRSLDGSPTAAGGRSSERLRSVLTELVGEEE